MIYLEETLNLSPATPKTLDRFIPTSIRCRIHPSGS